jgi:ankyrin repeat protein
MKITKAFIVLLAFCLPLTAFALTDDEQVVYTDALRTGKVNVVKKFLDHGTDANFTSFAWSSLQMAAGKGQLAVVKLLVERGADVNYQHPITKMTPLHLAAYEGYTDVVKYLLSKGADPNIKMRGNVSILRVVSDLGNTKMAELLESAGAKNDGCQEEKCL